ncbi:MAG: hypothetical protein J6W09_10990, partial [Bacteroidales bacterium]|nr:hypothetical protein [Bacteroidales bacterium]
MSGSAGNLVACESNLGSWGYFDIPNAQTGEWYVLMINNPSCAFGEVSFAKVSGSATTNCGIMAAVTSNYPAAAPRCVDRPLQLYCNVESETYSWTGPNGFTSNDQNPIILNPGPERSGTYCVTYGPAGHLTTTCTEVRILPTPSTPVISANPAPDPVSGIVSICKGDHVTLSAVEDQTYQNYQNCTYTWNVPSSGNVVATSIDVMPSIGGSYRLTVSDTTYRQEFGKVCQATAIQKIQVNTLPIVTVTPAVVTLCEAIGEVELTAIGSSRQCGTGCTYAWSGEGTDLHGVTGQVLTVSNGDVPDSLATGATFTVTATNSYGCTAEASAVVRLEAGSNPSECNVFYVSTKGDTASQGLTPYTPTTIQHAIQLASCTDAIIRMDTGIYKIDKSLQLASNITLEGGFFDEYRQKTSKPGATTIYRTAEKAEGTSLAPRLVAIEANSINDFRLQDLTVQTADARQLPLVETGTTNFDDQECANGTEPGELEFSFVYGQTANRYFPGPLPGNGNYRYAALYTPDEMGNAPFTITAIGYDVGHADPIPADGQPRRMKVWMKHANTNWQYFLAGTYRKWSNLLTSDAELVFDGIVCVDAGLVTIPVNFDYNGSSPLMILVENEGCHASGTCDVFCRYGTSGATNRPMCLGIADNSTGGTPWSANPDPTLANANAYRTNTYFYTCTDHSVEGVAVATVNVNNGAIPETFPLPGAHGHHRMAALYSATEIGTGPKMLTGFGLEVSSLTALAGGERTRSVRVYMKNTSSDALQGGQVWNSYLSGASLVYSGTLCIDGIDTVRIPISNFAYEGGNLMVLIEGEGCSTTGGCAVEVLCHTAPSASCVFFTTDDPIYHSVNTLSFSSNRPNIWFYSLSADEDDYYVPQSNYGVSTYAIHISNSYNYDLVRCQFISGNASAGRDGVKGKNGGPGGAGGDGAKGTNGYSYKSGSTVSSQGSWNGFFSGGAGGAAGVGGSSAGTVAPAGQGGQGGNGGGYNTGNLVAPCNGGAPGLDGGGTGGGGGEEIPQNISSSVVPGNGTQGPTEAVAINASPS